MVLISRNFGMFNQQNTQFFNNSSFNRNTFSYPNIEKTSTGFFYNYNQIPTNHHHPYYQANMYPAQTSPASPVEKSKTAKKNLPKSKTLSNSFKYKKNKETQKLFVVRHGERVDTTFGSGWMQNAFDNNGNYIRFNLNMPKSLPNRPDITDYDFDPPLTEIGLLQAKLHGEELARKGIKITHVYSSPALRSIQTADKILEGMNLKNTVPIRIETGLFELMSWQNFIPNKYPFIEADQLKKAGYNIDFSYYPAVPYEYIKSNENEESYYSRSHFMTMQILSRHLTSGENIMFVGHAPTIEGCTRQLTGGKPRSTEDFIRINRKVPFLSIAQCEKDIESGRWSLVQPMIPPMRHSQLEEFNFNDLGAKLINKYSNKKTNSNDYNTYPVRILF